MTFSDRVLELALNIPPGRVTTYGQLAKAAGGSPMTARSITSILSKFPNQKAVPWHRIVYSGGKVWLTKDCEEKRREIYELEGILVNQKGIITNFDEIFFDFTELN